ncbi:anti-sigma-D factor RsdA [Tsukamurella sp. NPDC003166]|uniref:anti-sigma-D factor RsdA n=1 Tax=Tsukamurella sp. NPDC003166 TaxID=3154444 RepID=UPI0033BC8544
MADDTNKPGNNQGRFDPQDPERTATHRLGPPMRPMRPGVPRDFRDGDTGFVDRVTDDGAPVDVAAVRRDDDLIEALAAGGAVTTADQTEFTLASLLADWRDEIVTTPVPSGPSIDEIVAATGGGRRGRGLRPARPVAPPPAPLVGGTPDAPSADGDVTDIANAPSRRGRRFGLIAGSAAAAVAIIGGGGVLVNSADPGDGALWSVKEVVFSDAASQTVATSEAKAQIAKADEEISGSNQAAAQTALVSARQQAAKVKNAKDRAALEERIRAAEARAGLPVGSTDLPTSAPSTPSAPPTSPTSPSTVPTRPPTTVPYPTILDTPVPTTRPTTPRPTPTTTRPTTTEPTTIEPTTTAPTTTATTVSTTTPPATTTTTPPPRTTSTSTAAATETTTVLPPELFPR